MIIKKNTLWMALILIIVVVAGYFLISFENKGSGNVNVSNDDVQVVKMYVQGASYVFEPSSVVKGKPVRIEADMSRMPGCAKSVVSSELGIRKVFSSSDNKVTFTPITEGTFYVACSMNMYKGNLIVTEFNGTKSAYVQEAPVSSGSSCGMNSGGGCGCGGN